MKHPYCDCRIWDIIAVPTTSVTERHTHIHMCLPECLGKRSIIRSTLDSLGLGQEGTDVLLQQPRPAKFIFN